MLLSWLIKSAFLTIPSTEGYERRMRRPTITARRRRNWRKSIKFAILEAYCAIKYLLYKTAPPILPTSNMGISAQPNVASILHVIPQILAHRNLSKNDHQTCDSTAERYEVIRVNRCIPITNSMKTPFPAQGFWIVSECATTTVIHGTYTLHEAEQTKLISRIK